jgi:hypothetical protein
MRNPPQWEQRTSVRLPCDLAFQRTPPASQTDFEAPQPRQRILQDSDSARRSSAQALGSTVMRNC